MILIVKMTEESDEMMVFFDNNIKILLINLYKEVK